MMIPPAHGDQQSFDRCPRSVRFSRVRTGGFRLSIGGPVQAVQTDKFGECSTYAFHASVRIPTELVRANARISRPIQQYRTGDDPPLYPLFDFAFGSAFHVSSFFCLVRSVFAGSNDGRVARSVFREMKNSAAGGIFSRYFSVEESVQGVAVRERQPVELSGQGFRGMRSGRSRRFRAALFPTWYFAMSLTASSSVWRVPS